MYLACAMIGDCCARPNVQIEVGECDQNLEQQIDQNDNKNKIANYEQDFFMQEVAEFHCIGGITTHCNHLKTQPKL